MILKRFIPPHTPSSGTQSTSPESWVRKHAAAWNLKQAGSAGKEASPSSRALVSPVDYLLKESLKSLFRSRKQSFDPHFLPSHFPTSFTSSTQTPKFWTQSMQSVSPWKMPPTFTYGFHSPSHLRFWRCQISSEVFLQSFIPLIFPPCQSSLSTVTICLSNRSHLSYRFSLAIELG